MRHSSILMLAFSFAACTGDDGHEHAPATGGHSSQYPTCDQIIKTCHPLDVGVGKISECHVFAHEATSDAECVAKKDECIAACVPGDAGAVDDAGGGDAAAD